MKNLKLILSFVIVAFFAFQTKATIYTIGNDTLYFFNDNYYFIGNNDTVLIDTTIIAVEFIENTSLSGISSFELNYGLSFHLELCSGGNQYTTPSGQSFINLCNSIDSDSRVEKLITYCFLELHEFEPDDDNIDDQWYLKNIGVYDDATLSGVWDITLGCSDVVIAVLDAGTDWHKEEFGPKYSSIDVIYKNPGEDEWSPWNHPNSGNGIDDDGNGYIDDLKGWDFDHVEMLSNCDNVFSSDNDPSSNSYWHGNAVAGIIAAKTNNGDGIAGIAGGNTENNKAGIKILPIKVNDKYKYWFYTDCYTAEHMSAANVAAAICYATDLGADVINMSFGIPQNPHTDFDSQIEYAYNAGVTLVGSAGNDGFYGRVAYPAKLSQVIAVGATDEDDNRWTESSHGQYLEISAPGEDVTVLTSGDGSVTEANGTSFSAPMVSATVGLMLSVNPNLINGSVNTDGSIRNILKRTADKTGTWGYDQNGWNEWLGYGRLNTYEAVCMAIDYKPEIVVQDDDIWTERVISKENIILEAGKNLTITGKVMMGKDAKIIVKQGATLTVDGGTITNMHFCGKENEMWNGIEVWGDPDDNQFEYTGHPQAQGKLVLNNATIENAIVAIRLFKYGNFSTTGGIVFAKNTTFKNNFRAVSIFPYKNILDINGNEYDYQAGFSNCTFTVDSEYLGPNSYNGEHMMIYGVKGIGIGGCIFENKLDNTPTGNAIYSYDAGFRIKGTCLNTEVSPCPTGEYQNTTFDGFHRAIESSNSSNALYQIYIRESEFSNNGFGIHFRSVNDAVVVGNKFELGRYDDCNYDAGVGIFLDNCKRFAIEGNSFMLTQNAPPTHYVGIHTVNTNNAFDEIYKNDFDDMIVANYAEGKNWYGEWWKGLAYYCNTNQRNSWDFYVEKAQSGEDGIQQEQGSRYYVAGNTFSPVATGHFDNWGSYEINYYYDQSTPAEVPDANKLYRVEPYPEQLYNTCPNHYSGGDILLTTTAYQQRESDYNSALKVPIIQP
ncbi:MAG: S8 family serine peptidase [Bacteroidales bacterium]|nr:S8 family serine peptidase [Bacteroidales bacterium]